MEPYVHLSADERPSSRRLCPSPMAPKSDSGIQAILAIDEGMRRYGPKNPSPTAPKAALCPAAVFAVSSQMMLLPKGDGSVNW